VESGHRDWITADPAEVFSIRHRVVTPLVLCWCGVIQTLLGAPTVRRFFVLSLRPSSRGFPRPRADALAAKLDLDLDGGICHACLGFVSLALDSGDAVEVAREIRRMTPYLWEDGLAESALTAVRRACDRGVTDADAALADLEQKGGKSSVARSIVHRLAGELLRRTRTRLLVEARTRDRLQLAPPELN
jgi:hypothetical protein